MTVPTIHLNGTSRDELLNNIADSLASLWSAIALVREKTAPNGRDYYPQGAEAFAQAVSEHSLRVGKLTDVYAELTELYNAIDAQGGQR